MALQKHKEGMRPEESSISTALSAGLAKTEGQSGVAGIDMDKGPDVGVDMDPEGAATSTCHHQSWRRAGAWVLVSRDAEIVAGAMHAASRHPRSGLDEEHAAKRAGKELPEACPTCVDPADVRNNVVVLKAPLRCSCVLAEDRDGHRFQLVPVLPGRWLGELAAFILAVPSTEGAAVRRRKLTSPFSVEQGRVSLVRGVRGLEWQGATRLPPCRPRKTSLANARLLRPICLDKDVAGSFC